MVQLDRTEQRIVGVLIEKQLSVPDTYPLSENALLDGCNQKSNRDPVTELLAFQIAGALMALQQKGVVAKLDGAGRVAKFRHKLDEVLQLDQTGLAILAELLLRGAQAPGALKPRIARMGCHQTPEQIDALLRRLAERRPPLVEQLPLGPRERDRRWRHRIGDGSEGEPAASHDESPPTAAKPALAGAPPAPVPGDSLAALERRVQALEDEVRFLRERLARGEPGGDSAR